MSTRRRRRAALPVLFAGGAAATYADKVLGYSPLQYLTLATDATDSSGNGHDGSATGVTFNPSGGPDGGAYAEFGGSGDYVNIYSAGLAAAFSAAEGTLAGWIRVSGSGVWTDSAVRRVTLLSIGVSDSITITRTATNNTLRFNYFAAGGSQNVDTTSSSTDWLHVALTWSDTANELRAYVDGSQVGSTVTLNNIGVGSLQTTTTCHGAGSTSATQVWSGDLAHMAIWTSALSGANISDLATV